MYAFYASATLNTNVKEIKELRRGKVASIIFRIIDMGRMFK